MHRLKVALAGVGGFGATHVAMAETLAGEGMIEIAAFTEPDDAAPAVVKLQNEGVRRYVNYDEMLATEDALDLVCIATPIHHHVSMASAAFERGLHVYLEKPPVVRIQDLRKLTARQEEAGVFCAVGFQDVARPMVATLKRAFCDGVIGEVRAIRGTARWRRADRYYARTPWAGKMRVGEQYVLDGPMNNACGHMLNLAAYLAGPDLHEFARPVSVQGELYRANAIDGEDTSCLRAAMDTGVEVCIHLTQCAPHQRPRAWTIVGENGTARLDDSNGVDLPGRHIDAAEPEPPNTTLLRRLVEVIVEADEPLLMPLAEAEGYLLLSNGAYESAGRITPIPEEYTDRIETEAGTAVVIQDIDTVMDTAYDGKLMSDSGAPWAVPTEPFDLDGYTEFPQRWSE